MSTFYVWATLMSPSSARLLASGLVERGYNVGPLASTGRLFWEGEASCFVAMNIEPGSSLNNITRRNLLDTIKEVLGGISSQYHSLLVHDHDANGSSFNWESSNIKLPPLPKKEEEPKKEEAKTRFDVIDD